MIKAFQLEHVVKGWTATISLLSYCIVTLHTTIIKLVLQDTPE